MKRSRVVILVVLLAVAASSCTTRYYVLDGDYNYQDFDGELSEQEIELRGKYITSARQVETFAERMLTNGFRVDAQGRVDVEEGELRVLGHPGREVGYAVHYEPSEPFQSVTVCWKIDSSAGHLILWTPIDGFGMPTFFNNPRGTGAHIHLDTLDGGTESLGNTRDNRRGYLIQEIRIEDNEVVLLVNEEEFARYPMDRPRLLNRFTVGNNGGGTGVVDWISIR